MKKLKYSSPFCSRYYFSEGLLPSEIYAGRKILRQSTPYVQHDNLELLLIRGGSGTLTVNNTEYPLSRGMLFCFSSNHFHKLTLHYGQTVETSVCNVNSGVYFYISACPYFLAQDRTVPVPPLLARLDEAQTLRVETLMNQIAQESERKDMRSGGNQSCFFLLLKLFGMLEKYQITNSF